MFAKFQLFRSTFNFISCKQLLTADDLHLPPKADTGAKFQISRLIFIFISCQQLLTAVDSWWQLCLKELNGIFIYALKLTPAPNFSSLGWFSFSSTVISCHQLLTAVDSWWQLIWKKIDWNFYVHTKVDTCAKFQLSRLFFIFINFYQLSSTFDSCWQLMTADMKKIQLEFLFTD